MSKGRIIDDDRVARTNDKAEAIERSNESRPKTGPKCPKCGDELWELETNPITFMITLRCSGIGCGHTETRLARG